MAGPQKSPTCARKNDLYPAISRQRACICICRSPVAARDIFCAAIHAHMFHIIIACVRHLLDVRDLVVHRIFPMGRLPLVGSLKLQVSFCKIDL